MSSRILRLWWAGALLTAALGAAPANAQTAPPDDAAPVSGEAPLRGGDADSLGGLPNLDAPPLQTDSAPDAADPSAPTARRRKKPGDLPQLAPYRGAQRLGLRGGADAPDTPNATPAPTVAAAPTPPPRRVIKREDNPFDPVGLHVGDLKLTPYIEQDVGYATNPLGASSGGKGSAVSVTEIGVALQSDWSRNELTGQAKLGYNSYFQVPGASAPYGSGLVDYRFDASRDLAFDTEGRYNIGAETNAQLGLGGQTSSNLTLLSTYGATAGGVEKFGDLSLGLHGSVDRVQYSGGQLATDDYTDYGLKLKTGYRLSDAVQPFAEVDGDIRMYDAAVDASGYDRASDGVAGKAGVDLKFSQMLTGEADAGWGVRGYRDSRLPNVGTPLFDASLIWSVTPLTTVTLKAASTINDAVVAGASGDINRAYTINVDHALTERIKLGVSGGYMTDRYVGIGQLDRTYTLGATAEYHLSREIVLKASAAHTQLVSGAPGGNYAADTFLLGVRFQR